MLKLNTYQCLAGTMPKHSPVLFKACISLITSLLQIAFTMRYVASMCCMQRCYHPFTWNVVYCLILYNKSIFVCTQDSIDGLAATIATLCGEYGARCLLSLERRPDKVVRNNNSRVLLVLASGVP